ncbi:hypothetical protein V5O48_011729 [Marasmius crinis-equi]|uniref:Pheromone receptor n=1 Tax=Marasmius crinis-equi TaxID=585013 RepID=A0ABR3F4R6_9AGAR
MSLSAKTFVPVSFSTSIQLFIFGCNTVLFVTAMRLLWKRNKFCPSTFHIVSTIVLFVIATVAAVTLTLETSAMMGEWAGVDLGACSLKPAMKVYRCYCVCNRSLKFIVLPALLILIAEGCYYANIREYLKVVFGANEVQDNPLTDTTNMISMITLVCTLTGQTILTSTIAFRIWWLMRDAQLTLVVPDRSRRQYNYTIAVVLESGLITPVFHTIYAGLMLDGMAKWTVTLSVMAAMLPQIAAFAPLLIVVRIGLGQAIEENTSGYLSRGEMIGTSNSNSRGLEFRATTTRLEFEQGEVTSIGHIRGSNSDVREEFKAEP